MFIFVLLVYLVFRIMDRYCLERLLDKFRYKNPTICICYMYLPVNILNKFFIFPFFKTSQPKKASIYKYIDFWSFEVRIKLVSYFKYLNCLNYRNRFKCTISIYVIRYSSSKMVFWSLWNNVNTNICAFILTCSW